MQDKLQKCSFSCNMNGDAQRVEEVRASQCGVFSKADLQVLMGERHPAAFTRRTKALIERGVLRRFARGVYVHREFDLPTLSQRLAEDSYISFGSALARHLVVGPRPDRQIVAAKPGRSHVYRALGLEIVHVHIKEQLDFGHVVDGGVRWADAEKAALDTLYFHLRGRRFPFDIWSDLDTTKLDRRRLEDYLEHYRNPKFVAFARNALGLE